MFFTVSEDILTYSGIVDQTGSDSITCSFCKINFTDSAQQRQHYKSDWHRYNLKQKLKSLEPISEENFEQQAGSIYSN